jgi:hypothetical protein
MPDGIEHADSIGRSGRSPGRSAGASPPAPLHSEASCAPARIPPPLVLTVAIGLAIVAAQGSPPQPAGAPAATESSDPPAPFYPHIVATGLRGGYQVVAADMNGNGRLDLIALGSQAAELVWYENPYWTPHVIIRNMPRMINLAAADTDGDGIPELALAYEFSTNAAQSVGKVAILAANGDPRNLWTATEIDAIATSHRIRFARIGGRQVLINAPIMNAKTRDGFNDPDRLPVSLRAYRPPDWTMEIVTEANQGVVHGLSVGDWTGDGNDDVFTAGYSGIFVHSLRPDGTWSRTELARGHPAEWPQGGASDIAAGMLNGRRFFVTNEPFHGNMVVVYQDAGNGRWTRNVIDTELGFSHSLILVDSNGNGSHEIVSGGTRGPAGSPRGTKPGVFFYRPVDAAAQTWERMVLDPNMAAQNCIAADITGNGTMDVACIDDTLKWYENMQRP